MKNRKAKLRDVNLPKIRGYVDTELIKQAISEFPDLVLVDSTSEQIAFVFKKAIQLSKRLKELSRKKGGESA